jgi:hypothetical protein
MADIIDGIVTEPTDPKVRAALKRTVRELELAIEKVAANHADPAAFPMPAAAGSTERILARQFGRLPVPIRDAAGTAVALRVGASALRQKKRLGDLAGVDLRKPEAVEEQVASMPFPEALVLRPAEAEALVAAVPGVEAAAEAEAAAIPKTTKIELRLHKVRCDDETNGFLGSEAFSDEIDLGATTVDESGDTGKVSPFRVASFDDGEVKVFNPPRRLTFFNLTEGKTFPKGYVAVLALAEIDSGGFNDFLRQLTEKVRERVTAALTAALGAAIGASGGPVGVLIGLAVGWVVGKVFDLISNIWKDDLFTPIPVRVSVSSLTARWAGRTDSPQRTVTFKGHGGQYTVTYDWRVFA